MTDEESKPKRFEFQYHGGQSRILEEGTFVLSYDLKHGNPSHLDRHGVSRLNEGYLISCIAENKPVVLTKGTSSEVSEVIPVGGLSRLIVIGEEE